MAINPNIKILVADDSGTMRVMFKQILKQAGFENIMKADGNGHVPMIIMALISIVSINWRLKQHALDEAKEKAMILLDRNMATHTYFSHQLKPALFEKLKDIFDEKYYPDYDIYGN